MRRSLTRRRRNTRPLYPVVLLLSAFVLATGPAASAHATQPTAVTIHVLRNASGDTWWSEGAISDDGVFIDDPGLFAGASNTYHVFRVYTGDDGSFVARADVRVLPTADPTRLAVRGPWAVVSGTGALAQLHGAGEVNEVLDLAVGQISGTWTGMVQS